MRRKIYLFPLLLAFFIQNGLAEIKLPSILGSNAVLQQNANISIWGMAEKSTTVTIYTSWDKQTYEVKVNKEGSFSQSIRTTRAGGPHFIKLNDGTAEVVLENLLMGEVWFCSGQSNMAMLMSGREKEPILNSEEIIKNSYNDNIRVFTAKQLIKTPSVGDSIGIWQNSAPSVIEKTSALAYQFAKKLEEELQVPVGIIVSSWGGTPIRAWMSEESIMDIAYEGNYISDALPQQPSTLYNGMVAPYINYTIRGILWYQGENDRMRIDQYREMMPAMVQDWREKFKNPDMPFYYVQIAPWLYRQDKERGAPYFREMQYELSKIIPNSGIAITADIGSDKTIHPSDKTTLAERLSNMALAKTYGYADLKYLGPEVKGITTVDNKIVIRFNNANHGLILKIDDTENFEVAGTDKIFYKATAKLIGKKLEVWSSEVSTPVAVRYGFKNFFQGNLFNQEGLPASPFRTDNW